MGKLSLLIFVTILGFIPNTLADSKYQKELKSKFKSYNSKTRKTDDRKYIPKTYLLISNVLRSTDYRDVSASDLEITEIIKSYQSFYDRDIDQSLVSIGPILNTCNCEDHSCTNQVSLSYQSNYIIFSKSEGEWHISSLYKWWHNYNKLYNELANVKNDTQAIKLQERINRLEENIPDCHF